MVKAGEVLYGPGDATYDLIVAEDATVEIVQPATRDEPEESLVRFGPGSFLGELNMLTTDVDITSDELGETWSALGRRPLPFETSVPGVFAVGDVRHGSMKRVAAAVGEGASAVRSVHTAIGVRA